MTILNDINSITVANKAVTKMFVFALSFSYFGSLTILCQYTYLSSVYQSDCGRENMCRVAGTLLN